MKKVLMKFCILSSGLLFTLSGLANSSFNKNQIKDVEKLQVSLQVKYKVDRKGVENILQFIKEFKAKKLDRFLVNNDLMKGVTEFDWADFYAYYLANNPKDGSKFVNIFRRFGDYLEQVREKSELDFRFKAQDFGENIEKLLGNVEDSLNYNLKNFSSITLNGSVGYIDRPELFSKDTLEQFSQIKVSEFGPSGVFMSPDKILSTIDRVHTQRDFEEADLKTLFVLMAIISQEADNSTEYSYDKVMSMFAKTFHMVSLAKVRLPSETLEFEVRLNKEYKYEYVELSVPSAVSEKIKNAYGSFKINLLEEYEDDLKYFFFEKEKLKFITDEMKLTSVGQRFESFHNPLGIISKLFFHDDFKEMFKGDVFQEAYYFQVKRNSSFVIGDPIFAIKNNIVYLAGIVHGHESDPVNNPRESSAPFVQMDYQQDTNFFVEEGNEIQLFFLRPELSAEINSRLP